MKLVAFCFLADWAVFCSAENSAVLIKYPTFEEYLSYFHVETSKKFLYILGFARKMWLTYKWEKNVTFGFKMNVIKQIHMS